MTARQDAILWWMQLFTELGTAAETGAKGTAGDLARHRAGALRELFFSLLTRLGTECLIEVGAHYGETSRQFVESNPKGRAFAYEAVPDVYNKAIADGLPARMEFFNCAIGTGGSEATFFVPVEERLLVWSSTAKRAGNVEVKEIKVPMISLDEAAARLPAGALRNVGLWIDVEGTALDVLKSGTDMLTNRVGVAFLEVNDFSAYEGSATALDIIELFLSLGFVPIARDNQYGDAWNLLVAHADGYYAAREHIARWFYQYSGLHIATKKIFQALDSN